ncbi:MAG: hypothetical protein M1823_000150 [Watsoniomyces obsoletus]|nr:MAG: hypothetical protein M1823_000150 [Watsoniomyces obsoletus]
MPKVAKVVPATNGVAKGTFNVNPIKPSPKIAQKPANVAPKFAQANTFGSAKPISLRNKPSGNDIRILPSSSDLARKLPQGNAPVPVAKGQVANPFMPQPNNFQISQKQRLPMDSTFEQSPTGEESLDGNVQPGGTDFPPPPTQRGFERDPSQPLQLNVPPPNQFSPGSPAPGESENPGDPKMDTEGFQGFPGQQQNQVPPQFGTDGDLSQPNQVPPQFGTDGDLSQPNQVPPSGTNQNLPGNGRNDPYAPGNSRLQGTAFNGQVPEEYKRVSLPPGVTFLKLEKLNMMVPTIAYEKSCPLCQELETKVYNTCFTKIPGDGSSAINTVRNCYIQRASALAGCDKQCVVAKKAQGGVMA